LTIAAPARFNRAPVWVTLFGLIPAITLARSASEGLGYTRLRFGLVYPECHPAFNQAAAPIPVDDAERLEALRALDLLDTPAEEPFDRFTRVLTLVLRVPMA